MNLDLQINSLVVIGHSKNRHIYNKIKRKNEFNFFIIIHFKIRMIVFAFINNKIYI